MNVPVKSSNGISVMPIETRLLCYRKIFLYGNIDFDLAEDFEKQMMFLNLESSFEPVDVLICSSGGDIDAGLKIYDAIQGSSAPVRTICMGRAFSMAAVLFASGSHGRFALPHSELMIHEPQINSHIGGTTASLQSFSDNLLKVKHRLNSILAKHTGRTEEEINQATSFDHFLTPEAAISFGLCDGVIDFSKIAERSDE